MTKARTKNGPTGSSMRPQVAVTPLRTRLQQSTYLIYVRICFTLSRVPAYAVLLFAFAALIGAPFTDLRTSRFSAPPPACVIYFAAAQQAVGYRWWQAITFSFLASSASSFVFTTRTPDQFLWGYTDPLLRCVHSLLRPASASRALQTTCFSGPNSGRQYYVRASRQLHLCSRCCQSHVL